MFKKTIIALSISLSALGSVQAADFQKGFECYENKDYQCVIAELKPLAGNKKQVVQGLYYLGRTYQKVAFKKEYDPDLLEGKRISEAEKYKEMARMTFERARSEGEAEAVHGDPEVLRLLGLMYLGGDGGPKDHSKALDYYTQSAKKDNLEALAELGFMYGGWNGFKEDPGRYVHYSSLAAEKGDITSAGNMAFWYSGQSKQANKFGVKKDLKKKIKYLLMAAKKPSSKLELEDYPRRLSEVASFYIYELNNYEKGVEFYQKAVDAGGHWEAQLKRAKGALICTTELFGVKLKCNDRDAIRSAIKAAGGQVERESSQYYADIYDSSLILKGSSKLIVWYYNNQFAKYQYIFPVGIEYHDKKINDLKEIVSFKYADPTESDCKYICEWDLDDNIDLKLVSDITSIRLEGRHWKVENLMQKKIDAKSKEEKEKKLKSQGNAF